MTKTVTSSTSRSGVLEELNDSLRYLVPCQALNSMLALIFIILEYKTYRLELRLRDGYHILSCDNEQTGRV